METTCQHLELVFLASTVTAAWQTGWTYSTTSAPAHLAARPVAPTPRVRFALAAAAQQEQRLS